MQYVEFIITRPDTGAALPGGKVTVYVAGTSTLATLYNSAGGGISNPATAGANGLVGFAAANGSYDFSGASADGSYVLPTIHKQQFYDLAGLDAQVAAAADSAGAASGSADAAAAAADNAAASAANAASGLNGTLARFMARVTANSGTVSSTAQTALDVLGKELWATGLIADIVYLNMRFGSNAAAARVPFVAPYGPGYDTGTISSWTEANGLASATLDTGVPLEETGCIEQGCFMGMYCLNQFANSGASGFALMGRYLDPDAAYGLRADGTLVYFDGYYGAGGRVSANRRKSLGGTLTFPTPGLIGAGYDAAGTGFVMRDGLMLTEAFGQTAPTVSPTPYRTAKIYCVNAQSGGEVILRNPTPTKVAALAGMMRRANNAIGRTISAEELA